jgi:hypothetical protein
MTARILDSARTRIAVLAAGLCAAIAACPAASPATAAANDPARGSAAATISGRYEANAADATAITAWSTAQSAAQFAAPRSRTGLGPATATAGTTFAGLALVNDVTRKPVLGLSPLVDGTVVDLTRLANRHISLRASLAHGGTAGRVTFTLTGAKGSAFSRTDVKPPYDLVDCPLLVTPDSYTLTVRADRGAPATVRFRVSATAVPVPALDVLFVGNSLLGTEMHGTGEDTPKIVRHLAKTAGRTLRVTEVIHFGNTLRETWDGGEVAKALSGGTRYDYIVLQEYSTLVATQPARATNTLVNFYSPTFRRALKPGGKVVLFKNWALTDPRPFAGRAANVAAIDANYAALSAGLATPNLLAPISEEFETVVATRGTSYLIVKDGKHPNDTAIYLDAVTLYGILFRESPRSLSDLYLGAPAAAAMRAVAAAQIGY